MENENKELNEIIKLDRATFTERAIYLDGKPFSLADYPLMRSIYNDPGITMLLLCGRQIGKSTTLCNFLGTEMMAIEQFKTLFISPSKEQTSRFSNTRFAKMIHFSPFIEKFYIDSRMPSNNVMLRMLANGSEIVFSYAQDNADRARGVSADRLCLDEVQSILLGEVEPVLRECLAASQYKFRLYCGTPLTFENDIETLWQRSTKNEWVVTCPHCQAKQLVTVGNLGDKFLMCRKCFKELDVKIGAWYSQDPTSKVTGYHISQLVVPRNVSTIPNPYTGVAPYESILEKRRDYSEQRFNNEVLGISDSIGSRLLNRDDLEKLCKDWFWEETNHAKPEIWKDVIQTVAGIDWSGQGISNVSRSVIVIFGILPDMKLRFMYGKIFHVGNPVNDVDEMAIICDIYRAMIVIADEGEGSLANGILRNKLGHHRVYGNRYGASNSSIKWNQRDGYYSDRTLMIDQIMLIYKHMQIEFPCIKQATPFIDDILAEYEESTAQGRRIWRHAANVPDDALHSMVFAWLASRVITGTVKMYENHEKTEK